MLPYDLVVVTQKLFLNLLQGGSSLSDDSVACLFAYTMAVSQSIAYVKYNTRAEYFEAVVDRNVRFRISSQFRQCIGFKV